METIRSIDLFRIIPRKLEEQTVCGAVSTPLLLATLVALCFIGYLILSKMEDFVFHDVSEEVAFQNLGVILAELDQRT